MSRIVIDAGHGGSSRAGSSSPYGARGAAGTLEKDVTLDIARHVAARLGGRATLTRTGDANLSLGQRAAYAGRGGGDVFVSIHANSGPPELGGAEAWVHADAGHGSRELALGIQRSLERLTSRYGGATSSGGAGCRSGQMAVLSPDLVGRGTDACLVEVDYLSSPRGEQRLRDPNERAAMGAAIAEAIREHTGRRYGTVGDPCLPTFNDANASLAPSAFDPSTWSIQELFNGIDSRDLSTDQHTRNERGGIIDEIRMHRDFVVKIQVNQLTDVGSAANPPEDEIWVQVDNACLAAGMAMTATRTARVGDTVSFTFSFADFPQHYQPLNIHIMEHDRAGTPGGVDTDDEIGPPINWDPRSGHITTSVGGGAYTVTIETQRH